MMNQEKPDMLNSANLKGVMQAIAQGLCSSEINRLCLKALPKLKLLTGASGGSDGNSYSGASGKGQGKRIHTSRCNAGPLCSCAPPKLWCDVVASHTKQMAAHSCIGGLHSSKMGVYVCPALWH